MEITLIKRTIREIAENYNDNGEGGVYAYDNRLVVRPPYQREFVYNDAQRKAVIDTILKGFPLNVMYWSKNADLSLEILDGQQRTISFCQFINGDFAIPYGESDDNMTYFKSLPEDVKERILDYELYIYVCKGNASEKLNWFRTINIAGAKLTEQELRNATYTGSWLASAKLIFSKTNCPANNLADGLLKKNPIRQELLETALKWISGNEICEYMSKHQFDEDASELWEYFQNVIEWVHNTFKCKYKEMCNIEWGELYNSYKDMELKPDELTAKVKTLMADEDVQNKKGIFYYVLDGEEKNLNLRQFRESEKRSVYEKQGGICPICGEHYEYEEMEGDHIVPWSKGGKTDISNLQMLCKKCNHEKSNRY